MSRTVSRRVPPQWAGRTVKEFCRSGLGLSSRLFVQCKHREGGLMRNGAPCRSIDVLAAGDLLSVSFPQERQEYDPVALPLSILWESQDYLIVDKPPAMPVYPSPGHDRDSLLNGVAYHYRETGQSPAFRPLYRLDRDTSGILAVAKNKAAVSSARAEKRYYAVCQGILRGSGRIDAPIALEPGSRIRRCCAPEGQPAVTHWSSLACQDGHTLLELRLETGRTHQIRVHLSSLGHPLAGDDLYGGSRKQISRQALHCGWLALFCPPLDVSARWFCPFPRDIEEAFPWILNFQQDQPSRGSGEKS